MQAAPPAEPVEPVDAAPSRAVDALHRVVAELPAGEPRPGQVAMCEAVATAIEAKRHLVVQAGTGTGKSLAYLVPAVLSGRTVVVATATKALQEQLVEKDLPFLKAHLGTDVRFALLKGRSNYLCRSALADVTGTADSPSLLPAGGPARLAEIAEWAGRTRTGDRSDLPFAVPNHEWSTCSVSVGECPGAARCAHGDTCFAEKARHAAAEADVIVVNTHLYGLHLASGGSVLPDHDVVIVDEAHALEDIAADTLGVTIAAGRFDHLARALRGLFTDAGPAAEVEAAGARLAGVLAACAGRRVDPAEGDLGTVLVRAAEVVATAASQVRSLDAGGDTATRKERLLQACGHLAGDLRLAGELGEGHVAWVPDDGAPSLRVASVDVGAELAGRLFAHTTVVLTSATLAVGGSFEPIAARLGVTEGTYDALDVGSPFAYDSQALLYCATHLPDPRAAGYEAAMLDELEGLIRAAGGRTLALFTSRRAMEAAAARLAPVLPWRVLVQDELPRPILQAEFLADERSCLFATMGFWQGFDAPGPTCSLVVIDRLPFSRPDDPLAEARRSAATRARQNAFGAVDLPHAAVLLAQGAGRLIRSASDRGVVAVLDRRLAVSSYQRTLVRSLPPMRRSRDGDEVRAVLAALDTGAPDTPR